MSQIMEEDMDGVSNELVVASQQGGFDEDEGYEVRALATYTKKDPMALVRDALVQVKDANAQFKSSVCLVLATHSYLEHLRNCFKTLDPDEFDSLVLAAKTVTSWHKFLLAVDPSAVDNSVGYFKYV